MGSSRVCYNSKSDYKEATRKLADYIYKNQISIAEINACKTICDLFIKILDIKF